MADEADPLGHRRLVGKARLWKDWDSSTKSEVSVGYWELFTDLLMVAAASSIADVYKEDASPQGLLEFALLYTTIATGWLLYTHHYTARFAEPSLAHKAVLFIYLVGMADEIVNAGVETARMFSLGVLLQRGAFVSMIVPIGVDLPRTRPFVGYWLGYTLGTMVCHAYVVCRPESALVAWSLAAVLDWTSELGSLCALRGNRLIPIDIEHSQERLGVLILVMLGETVISSTITYRQAAKEQGEESSTYYVVLALSFLLIFMLTLLYFNVEPPPSYHAFRRSRLTGTLCLVINKLLGMALLVIGVCIKESVEAVAEGEEESLSDTPRQLGYAVGVSLVLLLGMRCCHYLGRIPRPMDPPAVQRLMWIWWAIFGIVTVAPFGLARVVASTVPALATYAGLLLGFCIVEAWFVEVLEEHLPKAESSESEHLQPDKVTYQALTF